MNIGKRTEWGEYGALVSHVIDIAEKRDKGTPDTTITTIEAYFSYALSRGWQLYSSPVISYDWEGDTPLCRPFSRTLIYELHVRGFTQHPSSSVDPDLRGTYAGLIEKIPYLNDLGITAVELLPVFHSFLFK